jgi:ankyrin repeat protein
MDDMDYSEYTQTLHFFYVVEMCWYEEVERQILRDLDLYKEAVSVNKKLEGTTPLCEAAARGNVRIVELLLLFGAFVNEPRHNWLTPIEIASIGGHVDVVRKLHEYGGRLGRNSQGQCALYYAVKHGKEEVVRLLLELKADLHEVCECDGMKKISALFVAAERGHASIVNLLLNCGADVKHARSDGSCALHAAAEADRPDIVMNLLNAGSLVNQQTNIGHSALYVASQMGHINVVTLLLRYGANIYLPLRFSMPGHLPRTPLSIAELRGRELVTSAFDAIINTQKLASMVQLTVVASLDCFLENFKGSPIAQWAPCMLDAEKERLSIIAIGAVNDSENAYLLFYKDNVRVTAPASPQESLVAHSLLLPSNSGPSEQQQLAIPSTPSRVDEDKDWLAKCNRPSRRRSRKCLERVRTAASSDSRPSVYEFNKLPTPPPPPSTQTLDFDWMSKCNRSSHRHVSKKKPSERPASGLSSRSLSLVLSEKTSTGIAQEFQGQDEVVKRIKHEGVLAHRPTETLRVKWGIGATIPLRLWRGIVHDGVPGIRRLIISYLVHKNVATRLSLREFAAYAISHSGTYTIHERTAEEEQAAVVRSEFVRKVNEGLRVINLVDV